MVSVFRLTVFVLFLCLPLTVFAQADTLPEPERVSVTAADGLVMVGDFYRVPNATEPLPTVLLQHMLSGNRDQWLPLIPPLLEAGYHVLTVDLRGFGETRGTRSMEGSIDDTRFWFEWLHAQPDVQGDALALVGGSFGAVPALAGCAPEPGCLTSILISPGDFPLLNEALYASMSDRSVLFMVGRTDNVLYDTLRMFERTTGEAAMTVYNSSVHGTDMFRERSTQRASATAQVIHWLNDHLRVES